MLPAEIETSADDVEMNLVMKAIEYIKGKINLTTISDTFASIEFFHLIATPNFGR